MENEKSNLIPEPYLKNKAIIDAIPKGTKTILEAGCGECELVNYLVVKKYEVFAMDIYPPKKCKGRFFMGDVTEFNDFPIDRVDVVICSEVLEHIRDWRQALLNFFQVATKKIIITIPWKDSYYSPDHINFWDDKNIDEFKKIAKTSGEVKDIHINKRITKPEDGQLNQLIYFITIWMRD